MLTRLALLVLSGSLPQGTSPPNPDLRVTFIANAAVSLTNGRRMLVTDFPYESGAFGYMTYDRAAVQLGGDVTLLITHGHRDHFSPEAPREARWRVVGPADVTSALPATVGLSASAASTDGLVVTPIDTPHARVGHQSYRLEWLGRRFHFTGDTEDPAAVLRERGLDVAFVTPWIWQAVRKAGARIDAERVVIYHHRAGEAVPGCLSPCEVPAPGTSWTLTTRR